MCENNNNSGFGVLVFVLMLAFVIWLLASCTSNHYFSVTADSMESPKIEYKDSVQFNKVW